MSRQNRAREAAGASRWFTAAGLACLGAFAAGCGTGVAYELHRTAE